MCRRTYTQTYEEEDLYWFGGVISQADVKDMHTFSCSFRLWGNLDWTVHLLAFFWELIENQTTHVDTGWEIMGNSAQTVTWAQKQTEDTGAVKRKHYQLCHILPPVSFCISPDLYCTPISTECLTDLCNLHFILLSNLSLHLTASLSWQI